MKTHTISTQTKTAIIAALVTLGMVTAATPVAFAATVSCSQGFNESFNSSLFVNEERFRIERVGGVDGDYKNDIVNGAVNLWLRSTNNPKSIIMSTRDKFTGKFAVQSSIDLTNAGMGSETDISAYLENNSTSNGMRVSVTKTAGGYTIGVFSNVNGNSSVSEINEYQTSGTGNVTAIRIERNGDRYDISHLSNGAFVKSHEVIGGFRGEARVAVGYTALANTPDSYVRVEDLRVDCSQLEVPKGENLGTLRQTLKKQINGKLDRISAFKQQVREKFRQSLLTEDQRRMLLDGFNPQVDALEGLKSKLDSYTSSTLLSQEADMVFDNNPVGKWEKKLLQQQRLYILTRTKDSFAEALQVEQDKFNALSQPAANDPSYPLWNQTRQTLSSLTGNIQDIENSIAAGQTTLNGLTIDNISDKELYRATITALNGRITSVKQTVNTANTHLKTIRQNLKKLKPTG